MQCCLVVSPPPHPPSYSPFKTSHSHFMSSLYNPVSQASAAHMQMDMMSSTKAWTTHQWPSPQRKVMLLFSAAINFLL